MVTRAQQQNTIITGGELGLAPGDPEVVTPSNATNGYPARPYRGLMVTADGEAEGITVVVENEAGTVLRLDGLAPGVVHPIRCRRVLVSGDSGTTSDTRIIGFR